MKLSNYFGIVILIILLISLFINNINTSIIQSYPENNSIITERQPIFKWVGKANKLIIDDNEEFVSPIIKNVKGNSYQIEDKLNFTAYYWKLIGKKKSSVSQFRIDSIVALELKNKANLYKIANVGTADLDVEVVEEVPSVSKITGRFVLGFNETMQFNVKNKTIFVGKQRWKK